MVAVAFACTIEVKVRNPEPMTPMTKLTQRPIQNRFSTKFDNNKGYWQIRVAPEHLSKTALVNLDEHYEFVKMPLEILISEATQYYSEMNMD